MNPTVKATVAASPTLSLKVNVGDRHRIMSSSVKRGSLWVRPRKSDYSVLVTGEVERLLYQFIKSRHGLHYGEDQGRKYWLVQNVEDVVEIIRYFGTQ